jgi:hypothetical protein
MTQTLVDKSTTFLPGDRVIIFSIDVLGTIKSVRYDSANKAIYTVFTNDPAAVEDGVCYCREYEIKSFGERHD